MRRIKPSRVPLLRRRRATIGAFALVTALSGSSVSHASDFSTGGTFLALGHGARAHGLGGAGTAILRDDSAVYWNPANLAWLDARLGLTFMQADVLPGISDGYLTWSAAHAPGERLGEDVQGLRPRKFGYGVFVSHLGFDFEFNGGWAENVFLVGAAYSVTNYASVGLGVKGLQVANDFESADASGVGFDLALNVLLTQDVSLAFVGRDLWTRVSWDTSLWETLEPAVTAAVEYRALSRWAAVADIVVRESSAQRAAFAVEWQAYRELLWLRAAVTTITPGGRRSYPSFGVGVRHERFLVDYGASFDGDESLGTRHRVSVGVRF